MRHRPTAPDASAHAHALRAMVDAVAGAEDEAAALVSGLGEIVAALRADAGVIVRHGAVVASVGWDDRPPVLDPGASAPIDGGHVGIACRRALDANETLLLHSAAAMLDATARLAGRLAAERAARSAADVLASDLDGAAGRAYAENRLVVVEDHPGSPDGPPHFRDVGVTGAMAAPVHEH